MTEKSKIKPDSVYGISKFAGEMFINQIFKGSGIKTTIFRLFNTYGLGEDLNYLKKVWQYLFKLSWRNRCQSIKALKIIIHYQFIIKMKKLYYYKLL